MNLDHDQRDGPADRRAFQFTEERMAAIIAAAVKRVLTDPEVIETMGSVAITLIQKQAAKRTGNLVLSALKAIVTRWFLIVVLLLALGQVLGLPQAIKALAPVVTKGAP